MTTTAIDEWLHAAPAPHAQTTKKLLGLGMAISLGLHGLSLVIPTGGEKQEAASVKPEEKKVRITQLPTITKSTGIKSVKTQKTATLSKPTFSPPPTQPSNPIPPATPPKVTETKQTETKDDSKQSTSEENTSSAWDDFPIYPGAVAGCYGQSACFTTTKDLASVASFFEKELPGKKYQASPVLNKPDHKAYQVSRKGQGQILNILVDTTGTAIYVLAPEVIALGDLAKAIPVPPDVAEILGSTSAPDATPNSLAQPTIAFAGTKLKPGASAALLFDEAPEDVFPTYIQGNLGTRGINFDGPTAYNGGLLYTVDASKKLYVFILPSTKGGSVLTIWNVPPQ
ncbi:hypothetical protein [Alkalinema sp. FACHB-956]|uniref:hypothetical protein n=1 Tax=Alkalinema sp. FACHB-956 TaxID=2692768 RepID=UPI00168723B6|nr:hypothetical protein [Alkalinema sp. FACHB-956]MBD2329998.1 hypothetical protein [Alkalinema sp. FACHB-956]